MKNMIRLWNGELVTIQEEQFNREEILLKYQEYDVHRNVKFVITKNGRANRILDYRQILLKQTDKNNIVVEAPEIFDIVAEYFKKSQSLYTGYAIGVLNCSGQLAYILEYFDNDNLIGKQKDKYYYKWFYDPETKYAYRKQEFQRLFGKEKKIVFEAVEEYSVHLAKLLLRERKDGEIEIAFTDPRAAFFFNADEIEVLERTSKITERGYNRIIQSQGTGEKSIDLMTALYKAQLLKKYQLNSKKPFLIFHDEFAGNGLVDLMKFSIVNAALAEQKGYIPVIRITDNLNYGNFAGEDVWGYYFENIGEHGIEEAYASGNYQVLQRSNSSMIREQVEEVKNSTIVLDLYNLLPQIVWKKDILEYCESEVPKEFRQSKRILGVIARGTDYNAPAVIQRRGANLNHNATIGEVIQETKRMMEQEKYDAIYLATEDLYNYNEFVKVFGNKVISTKQERMDVVSNKQYEKYIIAKIPKKKQGFEYGLDYLVVLRCLAKCDALLSSMRCGACVAAVALNNKQYKTIRILKSKE